jgi:large conductance mechanosensitive channel
MLKDFKAFIMRGNVMDLAVAVIIGAAFGKIVSSLVADIIMPVVGIIGGGVNFTTLKVKIGGTIDKPVNLNYGNFIQATIDFLIIAAVIFIMVRLINKMQRPAMVTTKPCPRCTMNVALGATRCPHCTSDIAT